ncbi:CD166 antigen homolog A isoform X2 [Pelmatolapia mariae]|uniref:CD166 antigen homolog A isoform X2 n=1 Tax=Pelmatolapia mariae TaxID=158779 RepID=UPI002FE67BBC
MDTVALLLLFLVNAGTLVQVKGTANLTTLYGQTIVMPCNGGATPPEDLMFIKWKYEKDDGTPGDLLIKQARSDQATVQATDGYAQRVSIDRHFSLLITQASLKDQRTFTCMVVSDANLMEYPVSVVVNKKPSSVQIMDKSELLQKDKLTAVGTCVVAEANPAATIKWKKNGQLLKDDQKSVVITNHLKLDPDTGLSTVLSTLQYAATKEDADAIFACEATHTLIKQETELEPFPIHYLDLSLSPTGEVVKNVGETLSVKIEKSTSGDAKELWKKNGKMVKRPEFSNLTFADAGDYVCEVSLTGLTRRQSFQLVIEGKPRITSLTKYRAADGKDTVLTCEAEGVPKPQFQWSINNTIKEESSYINGKVIHKITIVPKENLTVTCNVSNRLGQHAETISVSSVFKEEKKGRGSPEDQDQAKLIGGVVAGLVLVGITVGLICWLCSKKSRQGTWKTKEEMNRSHENEKLKPSDCV